MSDWDSGWDGGYGDAVDGGDGATELGLQDGGPFGDARLGDHEPATSPAIGPLKGSTELPGGRDIDGDRYDQAGSPSVTDGVVMGVTDRDRAVARRSGASLRDVVLARVRHQVADRIRASRSTPPPPVPSPAPQTVDDVLALHARLSALLRDEFQPSAVVRIMKGGHASPPEHAQTWAYFTDPAFSERYEIVEAAGRARLAPADVATFVHGVYLTQTERIRRDLPIQTGGRGVSLGGVCPACGVPVDADGFCPCTH